MLTDYAIWLACLGFYLIDCTVRLRPGSLILEADERGRWHAVIPFLREQPRSRRFGFLTILAPHRAVVSLPWLSGADRLGERKELARFTNSMVALGVVAHISALVLFVIAPLMTAFRGLHVAVLLALAWHLVAFIVLLVVVTLKRRYWRMNWPAFAGLAFECLVCPGYMANLGRRVALRQSFIAYDGDRLLARYRRWQVPARSDALEAYAVELNEDGELTDAQLAQLRERIGR